MNGLTLSRCAVSVFAAATLLVGCGGLQPFSVTQVPVSQGQMPENPSRVTGVRQSPRSVRHASVTETVLYSFQGYDGIEPYAGRTYFKGTLYGTTRQGGAYDAGTVFSITPSGTETVLHSFMGDKDGALPEARLIVRNGTLYGTTRFHGNGCPHVRTYSGGCGTVFSITPSGHETVLHAFAGPPDGFYPTAPLLNVNGTFYGTTAFGGVHHIRSEGGGTVFSITPSGTEKVLHSFAGGSDGAFPLASLMNVKGRLYGTTAYGGTNQHHCGSSCYSAGGTIFSITASGTEKVLHSFANGSDGNNPDASLTDLGGTLYGTTALGGGSGCQSGDGCGTVFALTP